MKSAADVWEKLKSMMAAAMSDVAIETWFGDVEAWSRWVLPSPDCP